MSEMIKIEIDKLTSYDFITQVYAQVEPDVLRSLGKKLKEKSARFKLAFDQSFIEQLTIERFRAVIRTIFSTKKKARKWTDEQIPTIINQIELLIHGEEGLEQRFNEFCQFCESELKIKKPFEFASELLFFYNPQKYWLWSKWIWDPIAKTGSFPLVIVETPAIEELSMGEQYMHIGEMHNQIDLIADEVGIREPNTPKSSAFEIAIFLCAVFAVYMYTVTRMRMTKEFNTILPNLIELIQRMLGIHKFKGEEV